MDQRIASGARLGLIVRRRGDDVHLVVPAAELFGEMGNVLSNPAGVREVVRRDER